MNSGVKLSRKSKDFLEDLRLYLFSSGRKSDEIEEIVDELANHLSEAEDNGKSVEKVVGKSPKEYMESISNEMVVDYRTWIKYICLIILGSFSLSILPDLLEGNLSYSVLEIVGHILIGAIFIFLVFTGFKYISTTSKSLKWQGLILLAIAILPIALFVGLIYLDRIVGTPTVHFGNVGSLIIGVITVFFLIGMSIWAKTWILIMILALLTLPDYFLTLTPLKYETQLIISSLLTFGGIAIYLWISYKLAKR